MSKWNYKCREEVSLLWNDQEHCPKSSFFKREGLYYTEEFICNFLEYIIGKWSFQTLGFFYGYLEIHQLNCFSYFILFKFYIAICYSFVTISWEAFFNSSPLFLLEIRAFWMKEHKWTNKKNNPTQTEHKQKPMLRTLGLDILSMAWPSIWALVFFKKNYRFNQINRKCNFTKYSIIRTNGQAATKVETKVS